MFLSYNRVCVNAFYFPKLNIKLYPGEIVSIFVILLLVFFIVVNIVDMNRFVVRRRVIPTDKLPKGKKVRFVLLADLHSRQFDKGNNKLLTAIRNCEPDYILVAGDMITATLKKNNAPAVSFMKEICKDYKVYYGLGNHEYRAKIYPEDYGKMYENYFHDIASPNLTVLDNERCTVGDFEFLGLSIDREFYKKFRFPKMDMDYVSQMLGEPDPDKFSILIAHNPEYAKVYFEYPADLFVSGHFHGSLIRLPFIGGLISPSFRPFPKYTGGFYKKNGRYGYVSCGIGFHTFPIRFYNPGEVTVLEIEGTKSE